jgi:hypothetical protein
MKLLILIHSVLPEKKFFNILMLSTTKLHINGCNGGKGSEVIPTRYQLRREGASSCSSQVEDPHFVALLYPKTTRNSVVTSSLI